MVVQRLGDAIGNVRIRYAQVLDSYNTNDHSEGLFRAGVDSILVEHSLFDHLVTQIRSQSRDHYNGAYAAGAINAYIRAGFAQP